MIHMMANGSEVVEGQTRDFSIPFPLILDVDGFGEFVLRGAGFDQHCRQFFCLVAFLPPKKCFLFIALIAAVDEIGNGFTDLSH